MPYSRFGAQRRATPFSPSDLPECFAIPAPERRPAAPYRLVVHYFDRRPTGYGLGVVQVVEHDGRGGLGVESRAFVVSADDTLLELGEVPEAGSGAPPAAEVRPGHRLGVEKLRRTAPPQQPNPLAAHLRAV